MAKSSKPLTAFRTDWHLYTRVPFGLATCTQLLTRLLDHVFQDLKFDFVYHYLDDVFVYSENFEADLEHIRLVFDCLWQAGLTVKLEKVIFANQEIACLGHLISTAGVRIEHAQCFTSREFRQFYIGLGIKHIITSPYYPQPSHAERYNRNLRNAVIAYHF